MSTNLQAAAVDRATLPVIDIGGLRSGDPADRRAVADAIRRACLQHGFFYIVGHGVPADLQAALFAQARLLFDLPMAAKMAVALGNSTARRGYEPLEGQTLEPDAPPDLKEGFYVGREIAADDPRTLAGKFGHGPNQWPAGLPDFPPVMSAYYAEMGALAALILKGIALSLDLAEGYFDDYLREPIANLRPLHYPPQPANPTPNQKGAGAHTDFGSVTILLNDENAGLQVWDAATEGWIMADPIPGAFLVNLGDLMARWTNDRYRSTMHRVVNVSGRERYSAAFFMIGDPDTVIECLPGCRAPGEPARYPVTTVEGHFREMHRQTYAP
ncbi:MAG: isopenicillin N synthase family dioxygenase [Rhodospirillaceae bacterium]